MVMVTRFMDMHSGGDTKVEPYEYILIEAPEAEARAIFARLFNRVPDHVTCECCGQDYSANESPTVEQATAFDRGCRWDDAAGVWLEKPDTRYRSYRTVTPVEKHLQRRDVLFLRAPDFALPRGGS